MAGGAKTFRRRFLAVSLFMEERVRFVDLKVLNDNRALTIVGSLVSVGGCLFLKQPELFWQKIKITRNKGKYNFKIVGIGHASILSLRRPNVRHFIN
jgi:hypothetical protein